MNLQEASFICLFNVYLIGKTLRENTSSSLFVTYCGIEQFLGRISEFNGFEFLGLHAQFCRRVIRAVLLTPLAIVLQVDVEQHTLAKYLMELTLIDYDMVHYHPSQVAAAASCLSQKVLGHGKWVSAVLRNQLGYILGPLDMKGLSISQLPLKQLLKVQRP